MSTQPIPSPAGSDGRADAFLHVQTKRAGKIKGEGSTQGHTDDIEVRTWHWGVAAGTAIGSGAVTARRQYKHLVITKGLDTASTGLLSALARNDVVSEAKLMLRKAGGEALDYYRMTLSDARVVGIDLDFDTFGFPTETVTFAFAKIDIEYKRQEHSGMSGGSFSFTDAVFNP